MRDLDLANKGGCGQDDLADKGATHAQWLIPGTHIKVEEENQLHKVALWTPHPCCDMHPHTYTILKFLIKKTKTEGRKLLRKNSLGWISGVYACACVHSHTYTQIPEEVELERWLSDPVCSCRGPSGSVPSSYMVAYTISNLYYVLGYPMLFSGFHGHRHASDAQTYM